MVRKRLRNKDAMAEDARGSCIVPARASSKKIAIYVRNFYVSITLKRITALPRNNAFPAIKEKYCSARQQFYLRQ